MRSLGILMFQGIRIRGRQALQEGKECYYSDRAVVKGRWKMCRAQMSIRPHLELFSSHPTANCKRRTFPSGCRLFLPRGDLYTQIPELVTKTIDTDMRQRPHRPGRPDLLFWCDSRCSAASKIIFHHIVGG